MTITPVDGKFVAKLAFGPRRRVSDGRKCHEEEQPGLTSGDRLLV